MNIPAIRIELVLTQVVRGRLDVCIGAVRAVPPGWPAVDLVDARNDGLDNIRVGTGRATEAAHIVPIHQVEYALLAARKGQGSARNQQHARAAQVNVAVLEVGEVVRGEPACDDEVGAIASQFQEALAAVDGVACGSEGVPTVPLPVER